MSDACSTSDIEILRGKGTWVRHIGHLAPNGSKKLAGKRHLSVAGSRSQDVTSTNLYEDNHPLLFKP